MYLILIVYIEEYKPKGTLMMYSQLLIRTHVLTGRLKTRRYRAVCLRLKLLVQCKLKVEDFDCTRILISNNLLAISVCLDSWSVTDAVQYSSYIAPRFTACVLPTTTTSIACTTEKHPMHPVQLCRSGPSSTCNTKPNTLYPAACEH